MKLDIAKAPSMRDTHQPILIIDEAVFGKICSAILNEEGYDVGVTSSYAAMSSKDSSSRPSLVVTSYPFCCQDLKAFDNITAPVIMLTDQIDTMLMSLLKNYDNIFCLVKPIDYQRFKSLVKGVMLGEVSIPGGFNVY
jgi:DNA-binding response OmpR family regulator